MRTLINIAVLHFFVSVTALNTFRPLSEEGYTSLAFVLSFVARVLTIPARQVLQMLPQSGIILMFCFYLLNSIVWAALIVTIGRIFKADRQ